MVLLLQARREYRLLRGKKPRCLFSDRLSEETGYDRKHLNKQEGGSKTPIQESYRRPGCCFNQHSGFPACHWPSLSGTGFA